MKVYKQLLINTSVLIALQIIGGSSSAQCREPWKQQEFIIEIYQPPSTPVQQVWDDIAACNINLINTIWNNSALINAANVSGMKAFIADPALHDASAYPAVPTEAEIKGVVDKWTNHKGIYGYYVSDEPHASKFSWLAYIVAKLKWLDPAHPVIINLFPDVAKVSQLGTPDYEAYVSQYMHTVSPLILSYDNYVFANKNDIAGHFRNMETIRRYGLQYNVPYWYVGYALSTYGALSASEPGKPNRIPMDRYSLNFQAYSAAVYGYKGIGWFTYSNSIYNDAGSNQTAVINKDFTRSYIWPLLQKVNAEIKMLGPALMDLTSKAVYHVDSITPPGAVKFIPNTDPLVKEIATGSHIVVGRFKDNRNHNFVMFMNKKNAGTTITIKMKGKQRIERKNKTDGSWTICPVIDTTGGSTEFKLYLDPGSGELIRCVPLSTVVRKGIGKTCFYPGILYKDDIFKNGAEELICRSKEIQRDSNLIFVMNAYCV